MEPNIAGIGFVFTKDDPFCGIDLDDCYDPETQNTQAEATEILKKLSSYSEVSPSNKGIKVFVKGKLNAGSKNFGNVEMYDAGRFFTVTGNKLASFPSVIEDKSKEILELYNKMLGKSQEQKPINIHDSAWSGDIHSLPIAPETRKLIERGADKGTRSEALMTVVNALVGAYLSDQEIISIFNTYPIGEKYLEKGSSKESWLNKHIEKARAYVAEHHDPRVAEPAPLKSFSFPYEVISGVAGTYANEYGKILETPKEFLYLSYLTCLGSVLSRKLTLSSELKPQPRLFTLLLGQSADDRKSTSLLKTIELFKETIQKFNMSRGVGSAEGLQKNLEEAQDGILLLYLDEFNQFVSKCKIQSSVLLPCVNTLFESNWYESRTKTSKILLDNSYLSILAASTIQTYEATWDKAFTDIGFNNRLFIVPGTAKRKYSLPPKVSNGCKEGLKEDLLKVISCADKHKVLSLSPEAFAYYDKWYMNMKPSIHNKRLDTYAMRFMTLLAANEFKSEVDIESVKKATALCDWQLEVRKTHDPIDADSKSAVIEEKIRRALSAVPLPERELKQKINANRSGIWLFDMAKKNLEKAGEIICDSKTKTWRLLS